MAICCSNVESNACFMYATLYLHGGHLLPINIELQSGVAFSSAFYRANRMTGQNWSNDRLS